VTTAIDGTHAAHATAMARQSSGKVLLAGGVMDPASYAYDAAVARYTAAGVLDDLRPIADGLDLLPGGALVWISEH